MEASTPDVAVVPDARTLYENGKRVGVLHLSWLSLPSVPQDVWALGSTLVRLDLGYNRLAGISPEIANLTALEQLWLNDNPQLDALPTQIEFCKQLRVLDLSGTNVAR